ncbi:MAG: 50S ribosomal protein L11 methyltransferase [Acidimicrobiales bacterium]|nr:50S ribosomal protein L11 methyltransferase [Acidimicrobiales bacterium]MDG2217512.1 50S ribosomal protein L11 methyltransferase [Acidimicrobiales bacterium]
MHILVTVLGAAGDEILSTDAWIAGAVGVEERDNDLQIAFSDPEAGAAFAETTGGAIDQVADDTGLDEWRTHATTYQAGPFTIRPPWLPQTELPDLVIDPGRAFGSGSHASTQLAVELLCDQLGVLADQAVSSPRVADIGCGSGVLAVTAAILGATCVGVDVDPAAIDATNANATANGVAAAIEVRPGSVKEASGEYELAVANVTIDIHESIAADFRRHLVARHVIVAGLLAGPQEQRVASAYDAEVVERRQQGEWVALVLGLHDALPSDR